MSGGIAGIVDFTGRPVEAARLAALANAMPHRAKDGQRSWVAGPAGLVHLQMATTAEALRDTQPLHSSDGRFVLVMHGRIDDRQALLDALGSSAHDPSPTDAELALRAWERWGMDAVKRLDGHFALAVWDTFERRLTCARDAMGNKPFYYQWDGSTLIFASELQAVIGASSRALVPNEGMLAEFLAGDWVSRDETLWEGFMRLPPASVLTASREGPRISRYWHPSCALASFRRDEEVIEAYRHLLESRVRLLSRSHLPIACEVSGGLDSTAVFCIAQKMLRAGTLPAPGLTGFTTTFPDQAEADEVRFVRETGRALDVRIREIPRSMPPAAWYEERAARLLDFPGFPNASGFDDERREVAAAGHRVLLTGESADNWLDGSRLYYAEELMGGRLGELARLALADARHFGWRTAAFWLLRRGFFEVLSPRIQASVRSVLRKPLGSPVPDPVWLTPRYRELLRTRKRPPPPARSDVRRLGQLDTLVAADHAFNPQVVERLELDAARAGVELRHTYDFPKMVEFVLSIPERFRLQGDINKYVHFRAMEGVLPEVVRQRRDKADFTQFIIRQLLAQGERLEQDIAPRRAGWVIPAQIGLALRALQLPTGPRGAMWPLWSVIFCDALVTHADRRGLSPRVECPGEGEADAPVQRPESSATHGRTA